MRLFDVLGPVMTGPSSSHTAGAVRIGSTARRLLGEQPAEAEILLYGSFAATGRGHGTDRALVAGLLGLITGLITEPMPDFSQLGADTWMSLIYITVFASCVALGLQNAAVARVDPAQAALFLATESVFGVTFSILLLGEAPAISAYLGFALIFVGIVGSEYLPLRAEKIAAQKARATAEAAALDCKQVETQATDLEEADAFMR